MFKKIIVSVALWKSLIILFAYIATYTFPLKIEFTAGKFGSGMPYLFWIWGNFDGYHYMEIAQRGYQSLEQPFFPLLPLLIRLITIIFHFPYLISGLFISHLLLILALYVILKSLIIDGYKNKINLFLAAILLFPTSLFYGAVYNDSLFLFLASLTILFSRQKKWTSACIAGSLATLARLNGLALLIFILAEYLTNKVSESGQTWNLNKVRPFLYKQIYLEKLLETKIFFVSLIPATFIGYLIYNQLFFGHWYLLFKTMVIWHQDKLVLPIQVFWRYAKILFINSPAELTYWVAFIELMFVLFYIFLLIFSFKKIRLSYWLFAATSLLIPTLTGTFAGMPRYGLHLYPLFLALALFLHHQKKIFRLLYFALSLGLLFICLALFTRGYFIA